MWGSGYSSRATNISVAIDHANGTQTTTINQQQNAGQWNSLGQYYFNTTGKVTITAATGSTVSTCADAVKFAYVPVSFSCTSPVRIMPLGDSITYGMHSDETRPPELITGYRQPLDLLLLNAGYYVDFVGSMHTGELAAPLFDYEHEGHGGWRDDQVANNVYQWLTDHPADVILLHIGTNNLDPDPSDVEDILKEIDRYSEDITVVLARIINRQTYSATTTQFNNNIQAMAEDRIAEGDKIIIVDT